MDAHAAAMKVVLQQRQQCACTTMATMHSIIQPQCCHDVFASAEGEVLGVLHAFVWDARERIWTTGPIQRLYHLEGCAR